MRNRCMVGKKNRSETRFTLDTCVGRKAHENPNYLDMLKTQVDLEHSKVILTTVSIYEIEKRADYHFDDAKENLESSLGVKISVGKITDEMSILAEKLVENHELLHIPDNQILAHAILTDSVLVTCDRDLVRAAQQIGQQVMNPDTLCTDVSVKVKSNRYHKVVKEAIAKPAEIKHKVKKLALKPGQKILWRSFN